MNWLSLRNNRLKFIKISGKLSIILDKSIIMYLKLLKIKKKQKITTCNRLDLATLASWPTVLKYLPRHRSKIVVEKKKTCGFKKEGLQAQNNLTILGSLINIIGGFYDHLMSTRVNDHCGAIPLSHGWKKYKYKSNGVKCTLCRKPHILAYFS